MKSEEDKILYAIDVVCLNCVEDTLNDDMVCKKCSVRKLADSLDRNEDKRRQ